jgi:hypothetical protein
MVAPRNTGASSWSQAELELDALERVEVEAVGRERAVRVASQLEHVGVAALQPLDHDRPAVAGRRPHADQPLAEVLEPPIDAGVERRPRPQARFLQLGQHRVDRQRGRQLERRHQRARPARLQPRAHLRRRPRRQRAQRRDRPSVAGLRSPRQHRVRSVGMVPRPGQHLLERRRRQRVAIVGHRRALEHPRHHGAAVGHHPVDVEQQLQRPGVVERVDTWQDAPRMVGQDAVPDPRAQPRQRAGTISLDERHVGLAPRRHLPGQVRRRGRQLGAVGQAAQRRPHLVEVVAGHRGRRRHDGAGLRERHQPAVVTSFRLELTDRSGEGHTSDRVPRPEM